MIRSVSLAAVGFFSLYVPAQCDGWQQRTSYDMDVHLDAGSHRFDGTQSITYWNNSPDTLHTIFFHLYFNAFKPGSEMDVRSRWIDDPDARVGSRISELTPEEEGDLWVTQLLQGKKKAKLEHLGTVLKVHLPTPILPGKSTSFNTVFEGQVPLQIRRSGRDNKEGIAYSMSQWYPKVAEYDERGWHAIPYVGREFHGVWGDFKVNITLPREMVVAATGVLQNADEIGHGYVKNTKSSKAPELTWRFMARNVHDFAWAADPDFLHTTKQVPGGPLLHFFHQEQQEYKDIWDQLPDHMVKAFLFMNERFGEYPWPQYSFVQGGDGGMEYPMLTLITGKRKLGSLVGVSVHEFVHSWFHGMMASNEGRYPWMDEGFTEFASSKVMAHLFDREGNPHASAYSGYYRLARSGKEEPMSIHADHFNTNFAYSAATYNKGEVFVQQLGTVIGDKTLLRGMKRYYSTCKFKHPAPIDVERIMEKESGLELDWYFDEWINTTRQADYSIGRVMQQGDSIHITLERIGDQLMPVDLAVQRVDGSTQFYHIPLSLMLGSKPAGSERYDFTALEPWPWPNETYRVTIPGKFPELGLISIDHTDRVADMDRSNDVVIITEGFGGVIQR